MKKRQIKKNIKNMSDSELYEHVAYVEGKRLRRLLEAEFDKRYEEDFKQQEKMADELMYVSYEADELMKRR